MDKERFIVMTQAQLDELVQGCRCKCNCGEGKSHLQKFVTESAILAHFGWDSKVMQRARDNEGLPSILKGVNTATRPDGTVVRSKYTYLAADFDAWFSKYSSTLPEPVKPLKAIIGERKF